MFIRAYLIMSTMSWILVHSPTEKVSAVYFWMMWTAIQLLAFDCDTRNRIEAGRTFKAVVRVLHYFTDILPESRLFAGLSVIVGTTLILQCKESYHGGIMTCTLGQHGMGTNVQPLVFWTLINLFSLFFSLWEERFTRIVVQSLLLFIVVWSNAVYVQKFNAGEILHHEGSIVGAWMMKAWTYFYKIDNSVLFSVVYTEIPKEPVYFVFLGINLNHFLGV